MNTGRVIVVDYGMGNVLSVGRAIEHCGGTAQFLTK
jgi:imidazoleglycerol phosphate synthase glutamine amidotransferase subunit HisH